MGLDLTLFDPSDEPYPEELSGEVWELYLRFCNSAGHKWFSAIVSENTDPCESLYADYTKPKKLKKIAENMSRFPNLTKDGQQMAILLRIFAERGAWFMAH